MDEQEEDLGSFSSFDEDDDEVGVLSMNSSSSDLMEDATSSPSNDNLEEEDGSLFEMSNLIAQLPLKWAQLFYLWNFIQFVLYLVYHKLFEWLKLVFVLYIL